MCAANPFWLKMRLEHSLTNSDKKSMYSMYVVSVRLSDVQPLKWSIAVSLNIIRSPYYGLPISWNCDAYNMRHISRHVSWRRNSHCLTVYGFSRFLNYSWNDRLLMIHIFIGGATTWVYSNYGGQKTERNIDTEFRMDFFLLVTSTYDNFVRFSYRIVESTM